MKTPGLYHASINIGWSGSGFAPKIEVYMEGFARFTVYHLETAVAKEITLMSNAIEALERALLVEIEDREDVTKKLRERGLKEIAALRKSLTGESSNANMD